LNRFLRFYFDDTRRYIVYIVGICNVVIAILMRFETEIKQWGNSLALRISGAMAQEPMFAKGVQVIVETSDNQMTIKPKVESKHFRLPFNESELINGLTESTSHANELAKTTPKELYV
jgi:antitoxin MazE